MTLRRHARTERQNPPLRYGFMEGIRARGGATREASERAENGKSTLTKLHFLRHLGSTCQTIAKHSGMYRSEG